MFFHFLSVCRISFGHSFRVELMKTNSLCFPSSENVFNSFSFLKIIFIWYKILDWQSFQHLKGICHFFLTSLVFEKNLHLNPCFFIGTVSFLSGCFQDYFLSLFVKTIITICPSVDFFWFILLGVHWALWICKFLSFMKFEEFSIIISQRCIVP